MHAVRPGPDSSSRTCDVLHLAFTLQAIEDKTFGLKNKSKSAKVQGCETCLKPSCLPAAAAAADADAAAADAAADAAAAAATYHTCLCFRYVQQLQKSAQVNQQNKQNDDKKVQPELLHVWCQCPAQFLPLLPCQSSAGHAVSVTNAVSLLMQPLLCVC